MKSIYYLIMIVCQFILASEFGGFALVFGFLLYATGMFLGAELQKEKDKNKKDEADG